MSQPVQCGVRDCTNPATVALKFRGQLGHVHVCPPCEAIDREWTDIAASAPLPCPYGGCDIPMGYAQPTPLT